jgi:hypothetical protein
MHIDSMTWPQQMTVLNHSYTACNKFTDNIMKFERILWQHVPMQVSNYSSLTSIEVTLRICIIIQFQWRDLWSIPTSNHSSAASIQIYPEFKQMSTNTITRSLNQCRHRIIQSPSSLKSVKVWSNANPITRSLNQCNPQST